MNIKIIIKLTLAGVFAVFAAILIMDAMVLIAAIEAGMDPAAAANAFSSLAVTIGFFALVVIAILAIAKM